MLQDGVDVVDLLILLSRDILLEEAHRVHYSGNVVDVKNVFSRVSVRVWLLPLLVLILVDQVEQVSPELLLEAVDDHLGALFVLESLVRHHFILHDLLMARLFLVADVVDMHLVESVPYRLTPVVLDVRVHFLLRLLDLVHLLKLLLLLVLTHGDLPKLILANFVEAVVSRHGLSLFESLSDLL